jgi:hypothetical protein
MTRYALIGDVHSMGQNLAQALQHCKANRLTPVLLGDLFDSRCDVSETLYVYNLARMAQAEMGAIILNSNHGARLIEALNGDIEDEPYCSETFRTVREFEEAGVDTQALILWLAKMPDGFVFWDGAGHEHCCAHAYFMEGYRNRKAQRPYFVWARDEEDLEQFIWGPLNKNHRRVHWWGGKDPGFTRVAGHYHFVLDQPGALILDANSGFEDGGLLLYDVDAKKSVYFAQATATIEQTPQETA